MSTTTATTRTTSSKAAQTELFRNLVEDLDHNERQDLIIFLTKENKKNTTKTGRAKRAPKLDEDGNVVKKAISPGMAAWNAYVSYLKETLQELYPEAKITRKACLRLGSILKEKGAAADEGENCFYPEDNLTTETLQAEWDEWCALPAEEQYPKAEKKEKKSKGSDSEDEESEAEEPKPKAKASKASAEAPKKKAKAESEDEAEAPKPKARGRPKKASPLDEMEEEAAQSSSETVSSKKSKKSTKSKAAEEEEEAPKPKKASKKAAKVEESEAEAEVKPKKGKGKKKEE
jgi:hypothetical protein